MGISTLGYPSGPTDPLDSAMASVTDAQITANSTLMTSSTKGTSQVTSRQPTTATEVTAAASRSPTLIRSVVVLCVYISGAVLGKDFT